MIRIKKRSPAENILMGLMLLGERHSQNKNKYQFEYTQKRKQNNAAKTIMAGINGIVDANKRERVKNRLKLLTKEKFGVDLI